MIVPLIFYKIITSYVLCFSSELKNEYHFLVMVMKP